jgi:hypothetical protein
MKGKLLTRYHHTVHSGNLAGTPVPAQTIAGIQVFLIRSF